MRWLKRLLNCYNLSVVHFKFLTFKNLHIKFKFKLFIYKLKDVYLQIFIGKICKCIFYLHSPIMGLFYLQPSLMLGELFVDEEFLIFSFLGTYIPNFYFHKLDGYS